MNPRTWVSWIAKHAGDPFVTGAFRLLLATAASFAVYAVRVPTVESPEHSRSWGWLILDIFRWIRTGQANFDVARVFNSLELGLALAVQVGVAVLAWRALNRFHWTRLASLLVLLGLVWFAVPRLAGVTIPSFVLAEADKTRERALPEVCGFRGFFATRYRTPANLSDATPLVLASEVGEPAILHMPDCLVVPLLTGPRPANVRYEFAAPGGRLVYRVEQIQPPQESQRWYLAGPGRQPFRLLRDDVNAYNLVLSNDGEWLAWIDWTTRPAGSGPVVVRMHSFLTLAERSLTLELPFGHLELLALELDANLVILGLYPGWNEGVVASRPGDYYGFDMTGAKVWGPRTPSGIKTALDGIRFVGGGWVAWRKDSPGLSDHVAWDLGSGLGALRGLRGRRFISVDVSGDGRYIAVSERAHSRFFKGASASVYVVDTQSGSEVFRRNLTGHSNIQVRFPGEGFFAYSDDNGFCVKVFRLPG